MSNSNWRIEHVYRVGDKIFETREKAEKHISSLHATALEEDQIEKNIQTILLERQIIREKLIEKYKENNTPQEKCQCNLSYSETCLVHFCTCEEFDKKFSEKSYDHYICSHHKNLHFRNKGCFWCHHTDCSKYGC